MSRELYAWARRVCWVVDHGSSNAGAASVQRMPDAWPTADLMHPARPRILAQPDRDLLLHHAAQGDQAANFTGLDAVGLEQRLLALENRYSTTASPFDWRYTKHDLTASVNRLGTHESLSSAA
jgi:hypothetical protein